ncbi:GTPase [Arcanobacterium canis]
MMSKEIVAELSDRLRRLQVAVNSGGEFFDPFVSARAQDDLRRAEERMELGAGLTVAALVGGTGSGKSTMFNAITGLDFADAGELRPTTERAAACTWNADSHVLLDYLEVSEDRRIDHGSILTAGTDRLDGLVLLDLPDHDSVAIGHSVLVERLVPMVDLLIWVLDPQKYADEVLHRGYLSALTARADSMIVVLNQIDTVPESGKAALVADVKALLERDGLPDVPVLTASGLHGQGVDDIRQRLEVAVAADSVSARTASAELDAIALRLRSNLGESEPSLEMDAIESISDRIVRASGVGAVVESIRDAKGLTDSALVVPEQPSNTMVAAIRDTWLAHVREGLPIAWQEAVSAQVASPERLRRAIGGALRSVPLPSISRVPSLILIALGVLCAIAGIAVAARGIPFDDTVSRTVTALVGIVIFVVCWWCAKRRLAHHARVAAEHYENEVHQAIVDVTRENLVNGADTLIQRHRDTREALSFFLRG